MTGWIKLHRSLLEWEWYDDVNTKCLWICIIYYVCWRVRTDAILPNR